MIVREGGGRERGSSKKKRENVENKTGSQLCEASARPQARSAVQHHLRSAKQPLLSLFRKGKEPQKTSFVQLRPLLVPLRLVVTLSVGGVSLLRRSDGLVVYDVGGESDDGDAETGEEVAEPVSRGRRRERWREREWKGSRADRREKGVRRTKVG
jgi:hypothetical protein